jgi:hypothetical protein
MVRIFATELLPLPERNNRATGNNHEAAGESWQADWLLESHPGHDLRDDEKEDHIHA